jgi:hypothetical protein
LDTGNSKSYPGSGTAWTDLSRAGTNGTISGAVFNPSNKGILAFDQSNDYATVANTNLGSIGGKTPSCTIICWAYIIKKTSDYQHIFGYRNDSNFSFFFLLLDTISTTEARIQTTNGVYDINVDYSSYYNKWVHICFVANGTRTDLYLNGVLAGSNTSVAGTFGSTSSNFTIGISPNNLSSYPMRGSVGQTLFYNRPLTVSEILQNYSSTKDRYVILSSGIVTSNLVLNLDAGNVNSYYGASTTWFDLGTGANNATLTNGSTFNSSNGGSIVFDGSDDSAVLGSSISLSNSTNWTISAMIYISAFEGSVFGNVFSNNSGGPVTNAMGVVSSSGAGKIVYNYYDGAWQTKVANTLLSLNTWYYITWAMLSNNTIIMYLNGVADSTSTTGYGGPVNSIGRNWFSSFNGRIANVTYYNTNLTAAQILSNFNAIKGNFGI